MQYSDFFPFLIPFLILAILTGETISESAECYAQDCQYVLSHVLPACNVLVQGLKISYSYKTVLNFTGVLPWISFILNSLIRWTGKRDNFIFSLTPTFVTWYFCFPRKVCNMIPLFSQKLTQDDMLAVFLLEKIEIMLLTYEKNGGGMILFHSTGKFSYHR